MTYLVLLVDAALKILRICFKNKYDMSLVVNFNFKRAFDITLCASLSIG